MYAAFETATEQLATIKLPEGFVPVTAGLPSNDKPVLAIRRSGYTSGKFEIITARFQPIYRPQSPWRALSNDSVHDDGDAVLGWREAPEWLQPA